jgi:hypothetical protein
VALSWRTPSVRSTLIALCLGLGTAWAADLHVAGGADGSGASGRVAVTGWRVGDDTLDGGVGWLRGEGAAAVRWRRTLAAGPIGNLLVEGHAGRDALGAAAGLGGRGTAGPVALTVRLDAGDRPVAPWPVLDAAVDVTAVADPRRRTGAATSSALVTASATATWRAARAWTVVVEPHLVWTSVGWTAGGEASVRRAAWARDLDVSLRAAWLPGQVAGHTAVGFTLHHVPRRAPASSATVWYGAGSSGRGPGAELAWIVRDGAAETKLRAGWSAFWSDRPTAYVALDAQAPTEHGQWRLGLGWLSGRGGNLELGWSRPLTP